MKLIRILLEFVGALTILIIVTVTLYAWRAVSAQPRPTTADELKPVFNWIGFSPTQKFTLIGSSHSARGMNGDHFDYYCLQLQNIEFANDDTREWSAGQEQDPFLARAIEMAITGAITEGATCLPSVERASSGELRRYFLNVRGSGRSPTDVDLYLVDPLTRRLYFISSAT